MAKISKLKMNSSMFENVSGTSTIDKLSYVLINPPNNFELNYGDVVYLLKPGDL
jgi:hypothetical protein